MQPGGLQYASPDSLRGQLQGSPKDFFWDSITKYVAGVIIALAAIDSITEYIHGSKLTCLSSSIPVNFTDKEFLQVYCASSVPKESYFSSFITVHAILILVPQALWTNSYSGSFDYFFTQSRMIDRTRDYETGEYSLKNYIIARQLEKAFTNYKENKMFISYALMLLTQLVLTLLGFAIFIFFFTNFKATFPCPSDFNADSGEPFDWPLNDQIICVMKPISIYSTIRLANLILLGILIAAYIWSLIWCSSSHCVILGMRQVADFVFQTGLPSRYYVFDSPSLRGWSSSLKIPLHILLTYVPFIGSGPHIRTNLDFLLLKLFRTDNGIGTMIKEMLILSRMDNLNDNDHRMVKLHRMQQERVDFNSEGKTT